MDILSLTDFSHKIRLVWKARLSLLKVLFFLNRIVAFTASILLIFCAPILKFEISRQRTDGFSVKVLHGGSGKDVSLGIFTTELAPY